MNARRSRGLLLDIVLLGTVLLALAASVGTAGAARAEALAPAPALDLAVLDVSPSTLAPSTPGTVSFTVRLTNTTDRLLDHVSVVLRRGAPIDSVSALTDALAHPAPSSEALSTTPVEKPLGAALAAHASSTVTYTETVSRQTSSDICLCKVPGTVYPIEFTAVVDGADAGYTQTYLPAFEEPTAPVSVGWLWPLIDRPHRFDQDTVFTDDDLATSFAGGRLSRLLSVAESLPAGIRLTLVIDPELVDEAAVMASGTYRVQTAGGVVPGTGAQAAAQWLSRLRTLAAREEVSLTPWGDPDGNSLAAAGLPESPGVSAPQRARVVKALGGTFGSPVLWPPGETITPQALGRAEQDGVQTVVLRDSVVAGTGSTDAGSTSLGRLAHATVALTDAATRTLVDRALTGGQAATALPALVSRVSLRASQQPDDPGYLLLVPDRYLDPAVNSAVRAISETSTSFFTRPVPLQSAAAALSGADVGSVRAVGVPTLPQPNLDAALRAQDALATLRSAVPTGTSSDFGGLPLATRTDESAWWLRRPADGLAVAARLHTLAESMVDAVSIVQPAQGSYTLASSDSFLFVTVTNQLSTPARVVLSISTAGGVAGFRAQDVQQQLPANSRLTLKVPVHAERSGRFQVIGALHSPSGAPLGNPLWLSVNAESLGGIGVVITEVAAAVLALALCLRVFRRLRARRAPVGRW